MRDTSPRAYSLYELGERDLIVRDISGEICVLEENIANLGKGLVRGDILNISSVVIYSRAIQ